MAVILVYAANFSQAKDRFLLEPELRVDEGSEFLREIDRLINCNLGCLVFVGFHDESKALDIFRVLFEQCRVKLKHFFEIADFRKEDMKGLNASRAKNIVKKIHFVTELVGDFEEALRKFSDVNECDLQILPDVCLLHIVQSLNNFLQDFGFFGGLFVSNRLFLPVEMNSATHKDERGVKSHLVVLGVKIPPSVEDNLVIDALLLALVVDAHVAQNAKTKLSDLMLVLLAQNVINICL